MDCSLIITTYNWEKALELVILSSIRQSYLPVEIIVADDGSTDDTRKLIKNFNNWFGLKYVIVYYFFGVSTLNFIVAQLSSYRVTPFRRAARIYPLSPTDPSVVINQSPKAPNYSGVLPNKPVSSPI